MTRAEFNQIRRQAVHFSGIMLKNSQLAAQLSAWANEFLSFSFFAIEIPSAISAWQEAISPKCHSHMAQKSDSRRLAYCSFRMSLNISRAPGLNTTHRVLLRGLEIAKKVERDCQSAIGSNH